MDESDESDESDEMGPVERVGHALTMGARTRREDVRALHAEVLRHRTAADPNLSLRDLEMKIRDGFFDLRAVVGPEGGHPATKFLAAIMLNAALGEEGDEPPNYRTTEISIKPAGEFDPVRAQLEVIKPGGRSSHEIRQRLEAKLRELGVDPESVTS
jgi:hypothetical protein